MRTASLCHRQPTPPTPNLPTPNLPTYQEQRNARRQMMANDVPAAAVRLVAVKDGDCEGGWGGGGPPTHEHTLQAASSCSGEGTWQVQIARELASNPMPLPPPSLRQRWPHLSVTTPSTPYTPSQTRHLCLRSPELTSDRVSRTTRSGTQTAPGRCHESHRLAQSPNRHRAKAFRHRTYGGPRKGTHRRSPLMYASN